MASIEEGSDLFQRSKKQNGLSNRPVHPKGSGIIALVFNPRGMEDSPVERRPTTGILQKENALGCCLWGFGAEGFSAGFSECFALAAPFE